MLDESFKFKGGAWIGYMAYTWPFAKLEVSPDYLVLGIEGLPFDRSKRELRFTHDEIERVEVKKYFPIIAYGIHIVARNRKVTRLIYFWYLSFRFKKLVNALKEYGWLVAK